MTLNGTLWAGRRVAGNVRPVNVKPVPVRVACEIVRLEPPELLRLAAEVRLLPTCTLPKLRLCGLATSWPAVTPEPETATVDVDYIVLRYLRLL